MNPKAAMARTGALTLAGPDLDLFPPLVQLFQPAIDHVEDAQGLRLLGGEATNGEQSRSPGGSRRSARRTDVGAWEECVVGRGKKKQGQTRRPSSPTPDLFTEAILL